MLDRGREAVELLFQLRESAIRVTIVSASEVFASLLGGLECLDTLEEMAVLALHLVCPEKLGRVGRH
jgi:hypothetical protein